MYRIMVVEDDLSIAHVSQDGLVFEGFSVECVNDGREALEGVHRFQPHLILLDLTLPGVDGLELCRSLSQRGDHPSIIMLTARSQNEDKVLGLRLGADDYVTKPFAFNELLARVQAVLRRAHPFVEQLRLDAETVVDFRQFRVTRNDVPLSVSDREFELLRCLAEHAGKTVSRAELLHVVWGYSDMPLTRLVDNAIVRLRRKVERDPHKPKIIRTMHGDGYSLRPDR
jgi:DNA-binding response OmpR family regulator